MPSPAVDGNSSKENMATTAAGAHDDLSAYEVERLERIKRNQGVLQELGLLEDKRALATALNKPSSSERQPGGSPSKRSRRRQQQDAGEGEEGEPLQPARRSRRLEGLEAEAGGGVDRAAGSSGGGGVDRPRVAYAVGPSSKDAAVEDYNALNNYRLATMSEEALRRRIWKIRKPNKLASFIEVLKSTSQDELATEAEQALAQLTGG